MGAAAEHALFPDDQRNFLIGENLFLPQSPGSGASQHDGQRQRRR